MANVVFHCYLDIPDHYLDQAIEDPYGYLVEVGITDLWCGVVTLECIDD